MCLQRLEADSGRVEVLNSKPEEARTAVQHLQIKIPTLSKQRHNSKTSCNTVNAGERHVGTEQRGCWKGVDGDTRESELVA